MANKRLVQFGGKSAPTISDILYLGDMANAGLEVQTTIGQVIANNAITTVNGTYTVGNFAKFAAGNQIVDGGTPSVGFVDNATFISNASQGIVADTVTLNAAVLLSQTPGGGWALGGDGVTMKCPTTGSYLLNAHFYYQSLNSTQVIITTQFFVNGNPVLYPFAMGTSTDNEVINASLNANISLNANDAITVKATTTGGYNLYYVANTSPGVNISFTRLL